MNYLTKTMKLYRILILFWTAFIGIGAVGGASQMLIDPYNPMQMGALLVYFQKMPFSEYLFTNYIFSGISLLIVNGISNLVAFVLILRNKKLGYILGWIFGITLMLWICIQFWLFAPGIYAIDIVFFIFGALQFICGMLAFVNFRQLEFSFDVDEYSNINGENKKETVVYFSRMGYTKKLAYMKADELGCGITELVPKEKISGILGFWWCGRFGMHRWGMDIEKISGDFSQFEKVYVFSPVWVFSMSAPIRKFFQEKKDELNSVDLTMVHFMGAKLSSVFNKPTEMLGPKLIEKHSVRSHFGDTKKIY